VRGPRYGRRRPRARGGDRQADERSTDKRDDAGSELRTEMLCASGAGAVRRGWRGPLLIGRPAVGSYEDLDGAGDSRRRCGCVRARPGCEGSSSRGAAANRRFKDRGAGDRRAAGSGDGTRRADPRRDRDRRLGGMEGPRRTAPVAAGNGSPAEAASRWQDAGSSRSSSKGDPEAAVPRSLMPLMRSPWIGSGRPGPAPTANWLVFHEPARHPRRALRTAVVQSATETSSRELFSVFFLETTAVAA